MEKLIDFHVFIGPFSSSGNNI